MAGVILTYPPMFRPARLEPLARRNLEERTAPVILRHPSVAAVLPIPLLVLLVIGCAAVPAHAELDDEIGAAIERLQKYLYSQQQADGSWGDMANEDHHHGFGGQSAMATLALLYSGQSYQTDRLAKALSVLREHDPGRTYVVAVRAHIWASLPDEYLPTLGNEAEWLLRAHTGSLFDYTEYRQNRIDHSVTQYGVLGLWEFSKRGGTVPGAF